MSEGDGTISLNLTFASSGQRVNGAYNITLTNNLVSSGELFVCIFAPIY